MNYLIETKDSKREWVKPAMERQSLKEALANPGVVFTDIQGS